MTGPWDIDQVPERDVPGAEAVVLLALSSPVYELHRRHEAFLHVALANAAQGTDDRVVEWQIFEALSSMHPGHSTDRYRFARSGA